MNRKGKTLAIGVAGLALLGVFGLFCCTNPNSPHTRPDAHNPTPEEQPSKPTAGSEQTDVTREGQTDAAQAEAELPRLIEIEGEEKPAPPIPPYANIVEQFQPGQHGEVAGTIESETKLLVDTRNVKRLRLTREGTPLSRTRSVVLQLDGQGIEWSAKHIAIELERSPGGSWEVVARRPSDK